MTALRGDSIALQDSKDVPQFAPNFSVYVLPPDVVCLYSEHRKFFLHGELSCALATAIGARRSYRDIFRELTRTYPAEAIEEALRRMIDRRYLVTAARDTAATTTAYWTSLGLPFDVAKQNLEKCPVHLEAIDVEGEAALSAALGALGVRVARRSGDLTIVLASDYLEERLDAVNRRHLIAGTPWLLAQPSGIFPLVGPLFRPGEGACWACLAERMRRNREIKAFLDRSDARCVSTSPLVRDAVGQGAVQLAAIEIAKAIATGFRTDLSDHVVSLDLMGSSVVRHYVPTRPQCPVCGRAELRDPNRAPAPIVLHSGSKLVMTSGGYRAVSPRATVAKFRKHVSPLTGVVSRLERVDADVPLNTNYLAKHNFAPRPETVDELRSGLSGSSYGKGSTSEQGEASALMEAIERYSGIFQGDEIRVTHRFTDFPEGDAVPPNDVMLFSEAQYRQGRLPSAERDRASAGPLPFDPAAEIEWTPVWSLRDERFKYFPTSLVYFFHKGPGDNQAVADSNGCAAGNTLEEAIHQGFLELVERDSYALWWYNRVQRPQVDFSGLDDAYVRELTSQLADTGYKVWMLDITSDLGVPSYVAISHKVHEDHEHLEFGSGSHFDARIAALRALTELNQFLSVGAMEGDAHGDDGPPLLLRDHPYLLPSDAPMVRPDFSSKLGLLDRREQVLTCMRTVKQAGMDFLVLDQTRPDIEVPVARVIVPGMRHFYIRFAPGRLYDIPVKLGWLERPRTEAELNPVQPPT
jgi:bacteriocin biosynthesis cyclodehydratase domain-containing protein